MYDGAVNKRSGIVVINLPGVSENYHAAYGDREKGLLYPETTSWMYINTRAEYEHQYSYMPDRIIDNLLKAGVTMSVAPWNKINDSTLEFLIESAFGNRSNCEYDLSRSMRRANS